MAGNEMRRIVVVGPPGSGKSTLACALARRFDVRLFERDANGPLGSDEYRYAVDDLLGADGWVFDGFPYFVDAEIYGAADTVVALAFSHRLVLSNA